MKKFIALVMTALLVLALGVTVFADEPAPEFTDMPTVTVTKAYKLIGEGTSPAETFTLHMTGKRVLDGEAEVAPDLGTITGAEFAEGAATAEGAVANVTINLPTYESVGIYEYALKEVIGTTAGVSYYANNIKLIVTVIEHNGKIRVAAVHTEAEPLPGEEPIAKSDIFENTYTANTLSITKTVDGILGDRNKYFKFTVQLTGVAGKTYAASYAVTSRGSYTVEDPANAEATIPGNPEAVTVGTAEAPVVSTFWLKDGETVTIDNLPAGVTFTVIEDATEAEGYTITPTGNTGTTDGTPKVAAFTNTKGGTVDTGILLDSLPYVIIIGLVVAVGVAMIAKRRNAEKE